MSGLGPAARSRRRAVGVPPPMRPCPTRGHTHGRIRTRRKPRDADCARPRSARGRAGKAQSYEGAIYAPAGAARAPRPRTRGSADLAAKTIPLRADWDIQPRLGDGRGHHVARTGVDRALADFIERRAEGALLVVGHRGSGKTSSVVAAANRAAGWKKHKTVVPIMITATSMDKTGGEDHKTLLRSLIWALHRKADETVGISKKLRHQAKALYLDATATVKSVEMSQNKTRTLAVGGHAAAGVAASLALAVLALHGMIDLWPAVVPAILAPLVTKLAWDWGAKKSTTDLYKRDYGFADMQHDFEGLLREYGNAYRIVFILDEFDKDEDFASMIRPLKMLLNQGGAAYVVITAPKEAQELMIKREVNYTLFSEVLFINRPSFREMEKFIDDVLDGEGRKAVPAHEYDDFRCCMRYKSQTDFFDLYGALRDRRAGTDEEGRPLIAVSLDEQEATEANLQRSIEHVYDRKAYGAQSKQMINDGMLDAMYDAAAKAEEMHGGTIAVGDKEVAFGEVPAKYAHPQEESAVRDLVTFFYRQGYLTGPADGPYRIAGRLARFDPAGMFVEEENAFIEAYDSVLGALANFANVQSKLVDEHGEPFSSGLLDSRLDEMIRIAGSIVGIDIPEEARAYRAQLRLPSRPLIDPDKLRTHTNGIKTTLHTLRTHAVNLLARAFEHNGFPAALSDQIPDNLAALAFARGQNIRNAVYRWGGSGGEMAIAILPVQDASFISEVRSKASTLNYQTREIYIALVGDVEPVGLLDHAILVGSARDTERVGAGAGAGAGALKMAKKHSTYTLAVASPPNVKDVEAAVSAVKLVVARLESSKKESFEKFWPALLRAAWAAGDGPPSSRLQGGAPQ